MRSASRPNGAVFRCERQCTAWYISRHHGSLHATNSGWSHIRCGGRCSRRNTCMCGFHKRQREMLGCRRAGPTGIRGRITASIGSISGHAEHCANHHHNDIKYNNQHIVQFHYINVVDIYNSGAQRSIRATNSCLETEISHSETQSLHHRAHHCETRIARYPENITGENAIHHCAWFSVLHVCGHKGKRRTKGNMFCACHVDSKAWSAHITHSKSGGVIGDPSRAYAHAHDMRVRARAVKFFFFPYKIRLKSLCRPLP